MNLLELLTACALSIVGTQDSSPGVLGGSSSMIAPNILLPTLANPVLLPRATFLPVPGSVLGVAT